jgi:hypothetical protein
VSRPSGHGLRSYNGTWAAGLAEGNERPRWGCAVKGGAHPKPTLREGKVERLSWWKAVVRLGSQDRIAVIIAMPDARLVEVDVAIYGWTEYAQAGRGCVDP